MCSVTNNLYFYLVAGGGFWKTINMFGHSIQFNSVAQSCPTLCYPMNHSTLHLPVHHQLLEFTQTHVHRVGDAIQPSHPLSSPSPPSPNPSQIRVFSSESALHIRWPKYWSFSFSISPSNEHPGLISFRMDQLDLLAVQGACKSLLQHHSSKASILRCSGFFIVKLTSIHDYWKNHGFDQMELCWQSNVSAFLICCLGWSQLFFQGASFF